MRARRCFVVVAVLVAALGALNFHARAEGLYKYRDEQGNWVFTDRKPDDGREVEQLPLAEEITSPEISIARRKGEQGIELVAKNDCFCPAELALRVLRQAQGSVEPGEIVHSVLPARRAVVVNVVAGTAGQPPDAIGFEYRAVLGEPEVQHRDREVYRAPFAVARTFRVTQAYPTRVTHVDDSSAYAVDFEMPVGTQIYAARAGTVIEVASNYFEGGADPDKALRANIVRVLHADGTMALYAHLNLDSIRVRPGRVVKRGEYIADSGNTGFTTGPHLHFVVQRNAGMRLESLPVMFAGRSGERVTALTGQSVTAY
jgi:murein DD-endopeptidase MepM/ murein hydrolase activator NlpD